MTWAMLTVVSVSAIWAGSTVWKLQDTFSKSFVSKEVFVSEIRGLRTEMQAIRDVLVTKGAARDAAIDRLERKIDKIEGN